MCLNLFMSEVFCSCGWGCGCGSLIVKLNCCDTLWWDRPMCIIYCYGLPMILGMFCSSTMGKTIPDDSPSWLVWATILCYAAQDVLQLAKVVGSAHLGWKVDGPHPGRKVSTALDRSSRPVSVALLQLRPHNPAALHFYFSLSPQPTIPPSFSCWSLFVHRTSCCQPSDSIFLDPNPSELNFTKSWIHQSYTYRWSCLDVGYRSAPAVANVAAALCLLVCSHLLRLLNPCSLPFPE